MPMNPSSLDELAIQFGADKSSLLHDYTGYYERHFRDFQDQEVRLLEIGVAGGASLRMWNAWFSKGQILGIDHNPQVPRFEDNPQVRVEILDVAEQRDRLVQVVSDFKPHLVVDDGGHFASAQEAAFVAIWPLLERGGIYAVEDLCCSYRSGMGTFMPFVYALIDKINLHGKVEFAAQAPQGDVQSLHSYQSLVLVQKSPTC